jgi:hypothetical protein
MDIDFGFIAGKLTESRRKARAWERAMKAAQKAAIAINRAHEIEAEYKEPEVIYKAYRR